MNYGELFWLERKAVFQQTAIKQIIAIFFSRIWKRDALRYGIIDSPGLQITSCQKDKCVNCIYSFSAISR